MSYFSWGRKAIPTNIVSYKPTPPNIDTCTSLKASVVTPYRHDFNWNEVYGMGVVLVGKKFVLFGGYRGSGASRAANYVHEYDIINNEWRSIRVLNANIAFGRVKMAFIYDDKALAYIWHEHERHYNFASLDLVETEEWRLVSDKDGPSFIQGAAGCYLEKRREGCVCGHGGHSMELWIYLPKFRTWRKPKTKGTKPSPRISHAVCANENVVYVVGGMHAGVRLHQLDIHLMTIRADLFVWSTPEVTGYAPPTRYLFQIVCTGNRVYVFGGYGSGGEEDRLDIFFVDRSVWNYAGPGQATGNVQFTPEVEVRTKEHAMLKRNGAIWIFGGNGLASSTPVMIRPR